MKHDDAAVGRRGFLARVGALVAVAVGVATSKTSAPDERELRLARWSEGRFRLSEFDAYRLEPTMWSRGVDDPEVIIPLRRYRNGRLGVLTSGANGPTR